MTREEGQEYLINSIRGNNPSIRGTMVAEKNMKLHEGLPLFGDVTGNNLGAYAGNLAGGFASNFTGGLGDLMTFVGADTPANALHDASNWFEERMPAPKPAEFSWDYISSPAGLARGTGQTTGSIASMLLPTAVIPGGWLTNIGRAAQAVPLAGKLFSTANPATVGRFFTSGIPEAAMEGGNFYNNAIAKGMNPEEAWNNRWGVFARNAAFLPISNAMQYGLFTKLFGGKPAISAAGELLSQGAEEFEQEAFQKQALGEPYTYNPLDAVADPKKYADQIQAFKEGFLTFAPMAIGGYVGGKIRNRNNESPPTDTATTPPQGTADTPPQNSANDNALRSWAGEKSSGYMSDDAYNELVKAANKYGVPVERALATALAESHGEHFRGDGVLTSPVGALGIMQLMPDTAESLGVDPFDLKQNIDGGVRYLKQMYDKFKDWDLAHAAYNAGPGAVDRYKGVPDYKETNGYLQNINNFLSDLPDYQGGEQASGDNAQESDEDIYIGENGKGEGTYWVRQGDQVSFDGAQPDLMNAIDMLAKYYYDNTGKKLVITAGTNGNHAEGEHSHGAGWKVDVVDYGGGEVGENEDGPLTTANFGKGSFADDFISYGRSLGLGMNWEGEGTNNVHIDVALDGTQWDGNGEHAGGFNPKNGRSRKGGTVNPAGATPPDDETGEDSDVKPAPQPATYENIIKSILGDNDNVKFNTNYDDEGTLQSISDFATSQKDTATGNAALNLQSVFDTDGTFIPGHKSRKTLEDTFGDELTEFGQGQLNQRWSDLIKKSIQPGFIDNLTEDDKRLFGNILLNKMKNAGIDLKKDIPAVAKQKIKEGDEKTTVNAWQMLQDKLQKNQEAEPIFSEKTQKALDDIAQRVNELSLSSDENAGQQTQDLTKLYKDISKLSGEINNLNQDRDKASATKGNQAAQVDAQGNIAKINADIQKKQAELDAKIDSFYNPQQAPKVEPSQVFKPVKTQADNAIAKIDQQIESLRAQGFDDISDEIDNLNDTKYDIQRLTNELADLDAQIVTAKQQKQSATDDKARGTARTQQDKAATAYGKKKKALDKILNSLAEPAPPQPFQPVGDFVTDELAKIAQDKQYIRDNGGTADEIANLINRQKKIKDDNNRIQQDIQKLNELEQQLLNEHDPQKSEDIRDQRDMLAGKLNQSMKKLRDYINPPQPAKPEPSKYFKNHTQKANEVVAQLEQQKQGLDEDSDEFDALERKQNEILAAMEDMEKYDAQIQTARQQRNGKKGKDYIKADKAVKTASDNYKKSRQVLTDILTPKEEPTPAQKLPGFSNTIADGLAKLEQTKQNLRNDPNATATDRNNVRKQLDKAYEDNAELVQAGEQVKEIEQQIANAPDEDTRNKLLDEKDALEAAIESKKQKLEDSLNPKPKKTPKQYDALPDYAKEELSKVNRQLLNADDSGTAEDKPSAKDLTARQNKLLEFNKELGQAQDKVNEAAEAWANIKDSNAGETEKAKAMGAYKVAKDNLAKKQKELDEYIHPPVKEKPEPFEPYNDEVRDKLAEIDKRLDNQNLDAATIKQLGTQRQNIVNQSKVASGYQKQIDEQQAIMGDASKTPDEKRRAKIKQASLQIDLDTATNTLNETINPTPKPEPKPEHYEATGEAKDAIDKLDAEIEELRKQDEEGNSAEISKKSKRRDAIQTQVDKIGKVKELIDKKENERRQAEAEGKKQTANKLTREIADKRETLKEDNDELNNILHPKNEDDEPVKTYQPVNDTVKAAFETLDKKITQAPEGSAEEIDLQAEKRELRRKNDRAAKLKDEADQLEKNVVNTKDGTKARVDAEDKLDAKRKTLRTALTTLNNLAKKINPPPKPEPKPEHYPLTGEAETETNKLYDEIDKLSDTRENEKANAEQINTLYDRIDKIQTAFDNLEKAKENLAEWETKRANPDTTPGDKRTAGQKISDWNTKLQKAETTLDQALHPRNEDDEPVQTYQPVNDTVKDAFNVLDKKITQAPKGSEEKENLELDRRELKRQNKRVAKLRDEIKQLEQDKSNTKEGTRAREDVENKLDAKRKQFVTASRTLANTVKKINPPPEPVKEKEPEHYEPAGEAKDAIDQLYNEIDALSKTKEEERANAVPIKAKYDRIDEIQTAFDNVEKAKRNAAKFNAEGDKKKANHWVVKTQEAENELDKTLHPVNEDDEPVKTYQPVNDTVKAAFETLDKKIAQAPEGSKERRDLERSRRELNGQNTTVAQADEKIKQLEEALGRKQPGSKGEAKALRDLDTAEGNRDRAYTRLMKLAGAWTQKTNAVEPIDDNVAKAIADLEKQIADAMDKGKSVAELEDRLGEIIQLNDRVASNRRNAEKREKDKQQALRNHNAKKANAIQRTIDWHTPRDAKIEKRLNDLVNPQEVKKEETKKPEPPKEIEIEDEQVLAKLDSLQEEIDELKAEDEMINAQEIKEKENLRKKINDTAKAIAKFKAQGKNTTQPEESLKKLMTPKLPQKRKGVTPQARVALESLNKQQASLTKGIAGKSPEERKQIIQKLADIQQAIKDLHEQNSLTAALQDKVGRISTALGEAANKNDSASLQKYSDLLGKYQGELDTEMATLTAMAEQHLPAKAKASSDKPAEKKTKKKAESVKADEPKPDEQQSVKAEETQQPPPKTEQQPKTDEQAETPEESEPEQKNKDDSPPKNPIAKILRDAANKPLAEIDSLTGKKLTAAGDSGVFVKTSNDSMRIKKLPADRRSLEQADLYGTPLRVEYVVEYAPSKTNNLNTEEKELLKQINAYNNEEDNDIIGTGLYGTRFVVRGNLQKAKDFAKGLKAVMDSVSPSESSEQQPAPPKTAAPKPDKKSAKPKKETQQETQPTPTENVERKKIIIRTKVAKNGNVRVTIDGRHETVADAAIWLNQSDAAERFEVINEHGEKADLTKWNTGIGGPNAAIQLIGDRIREHAKKTAANEEVNPEEQADEQQEPQEPEQAEIAEPEETLEEDIEDEGVVGDDENEFGSTDETFLELDKVLAKSGITPIKQEKTAEAQVDTRRPKLVDFVDDSEENEERLAAAWKKETSKLSANPIFNPKLWRIGLELGAIYVQRGINHFADWAKKMSEKLGKESEPWQTAIWETINAVPEGSKFDEEQVVAISRVIGGLQRERKAKSVEDVRAQFEQRYGKQAVEQMLPMIQASYTGIGRYFTDQEQRAAKEKKKARKEPTNPIEKAVQKIADLIDEWNEKSLDAWQKKNPHRAAPPTREVQELADMVSEGVVNPDKAVDAADKLLNGEGKEQNKAREILYDARAKRDEKQKTDKENQPPAEKTESTEDEKPPQGKKTKAKTNKKKDVIAPSGRVRGRDEVFTPPHIVEQMLDNLGDAYWNDPTKTFLEPSAGEGAFTTAALKRKLDRHAQLKYKTPEQFHGDMLRALSTVYSVELQADNVAELKKNMREVFLNHYREQTGKELDKTSELFKKMDEIINANNIQGDFLKLAKENLDENGNPDGTNGFDEVYRDWKDVSFDNISAEPKTKKPTDETPTPEVEQDEEIIESGEEATEDADEEPGEAEIEEQPAPPAEEAPDDEQENEQETSIGESDFEKGTFTNPDTGKRQAGIRFTKQLPQQKYRRIEELASEYGGYWFTDSNAILFPNAEERDAFVDALNGIYRGSEITKPLSQARNVQNLKRTLQDFYRLDAPNLERLQTSFHSLKDWIISLIDRFAQLDMMKLVDGKIEYTNEKDYETAKTLFANLVQTKPAGTVELKPLPKIEDLKKTVREILADLGNGTEIIISPQWDKREEYTATDAKNFSIIPQRNLAEDVFKVSYGNFGLAAYDTEEQALDAFRALAKAIKRGDRKFIFPNPDVEEALDDEQKETPATRGELVYPDGALKYGGKSAVEEYKGDEIEDTQFDEKMKRRIKVNGQTMTRLEAVESMAKGELPEDAMKLNKVEQDYLSWLKRYIIEPLKKIQQAGIQNDDVLPYNYNMTTELTNSVGMSRSPKDTMTFTNLKKLADVFGGTATENQSGNVVFKFDTPKTAGEFRRAARLFVNNGHSDYFSGNETEQDEAEFNETTETEEQSATAQVPQPVDKTDSARDVEKQIDNLINDWRGESVSLDPKVQSERYQRKQKASNLPILVLEGLMTPEKAIDTANKLLNGTQSEQTEANRIYGDAVNQLKEKLIPELNKIAEKFPSLKRDVEDSIDRMNLGDDPLNNKTYAWVHQSDDKLELEAAQKLLYQWKAPYDSQLYEDAFRETPATVAGQRYAEATDILKKARDGKIPAKGIYKQIEALLNAPNENLLEDDERDKRRSVADRVEYLFFKNHGKASLETIQKDFEEVFGKEFADEISPRIEAAYNKLANDNETVYTAKENSARRKSVLTTTKNKETESAVGNAFNVNSKNFRRIDSLRNEIYANIKADEHPNFKAYVDTLINTIMYPPRGNKGRKEHNDAIRKIQSLNKPYSDEELELMEENFTPENATEDKPQPKAQVDAGKITPEDKSGAATDKAKPDEQAPTISNPFDVEIPQNALTQRNDFKKAYSDMKDVWDKYQKGELDIREAWHIVDKAVKTYEKISLGGANSPALKDLEKIRTNIHQILHSPEEKSKDKTGFEKFMALCNKIFDAHEHGVFSGEQFLRLRKEITDLVNENLTNIAGQTAYKRLKEALPRDFDNNLATEKEFTDPIENLAHAALKMAGLERNSAPKKYTIESEYQSAVMIGEAGELDTRTKQVFSILAKQLRGHSFTDQGNSGKWGYNFYGDKKQAAQAFKKALNIYFGNEEASGNVEESGTGERSDDRYRDVEPDVREEADEEARAQGGTEISGEDSGQQRPNAEDVGTGNPESNAEDARPAEKDDAGSTGSRTGTGDGLRGNTGTVQPATGAESGNAGVSSTADDVTRRKTLATLSVYSNEALSPDELKSIWDVADESENPAESLKERYPNSNVWREKQTAYSDHDSINIGLNGTHQEDATYEYNLWANDFNPQATKSALERAKRSSLIGEKIAEIYSDGELPKSTLHLQADIDRLLKQVPKKHKKKATVVDELEEETTADDVPGSTEKKPSVSELESAESLSDEGFLKHIENGNTVNLIERVDRRAREALKAAGIKKPPYKDKFAVYMGRGDEEFFRYPVGEYKGDKWCVNVSTDYDTLKYFEKIAGKVDELAETFNGEKLSFDSKKDFFWTFDNFDDCITCYRALRLYAGKGTTFKERFTDANDFDNEISYLAEIDEAIHKALEQLGAKFIDGQISYPNEKIRDAVERVVLFIMPKDGAPNFSLLETVFDRIKRTSNAMIERKAHEILESAGLEGKRIKATFEGRNEAGEIVQSPIKATVKGTEIYLTTAELIDSQYPTEPLALQAKRELPKELSDLFWHTLPGDFIYPPFGVLAAKDCRTRFEAEALARAVNIYKSAKTTRSIKAADQLVEDYRDKKISAQEYYQQMGELLYPKEFAETKADKPLTDAQITDAAKNPDTAQQLPPAKQTDAPQQIITASKPATAKSLSDVKNFRELGQYLKKVWKMQLIPHYQKLSFERLKSYLLGFEDVLSQFTRSWGRVSKMGMDYRTNLIGSFGWGAFRRQLSLNIKYKEFAKKMGKGDHLRATGRHEAGHFIDNLTEIRLGIANPRYREHSKDLVEWAYEILKQNGETRSLLEMRANISDYATKNYSETVAEAVKQYIEYRVEAAPLSKAIFDCLKRADTTDEWFNREILGIKPGTKRLHEFAGRLTSGAVLKWYTHHNNKGTADTKTLQGYAAALLYDGGLRENLEKLRNEGADTQSWEETLKAHVPDERIMASSDEWTDTRINEAAKITYVANAFDQLGAEIKNGKVTFPDEETKQLCINHLKEIENPDFRLSLTGSSDTTISNFLSTHELTDQQRLIQRMGRDMGVCVVFFSNDNANFRGAHAGNISYINVKGNWNLGKVFWHESSHWIKANNRELWERIRDAAGITPEQRKAYVKETQRTDLKTDAEIDEEIISDYMEDAVKRAGFLSKLGRKDPSLVQRIVAWLQDAMSKFFEYFNNPTGKLTNAQRDRMANELGRIAKDLVNQKGEKIFRYNNRTHALTLPDGRSLKTLARTPGAVIDLQQVIGDNDNEISQRVFDKYLTEGLMKIARDNIAKEISEHVDLSKMNDPVERDEARENLPTIRKMRVWYNENYIQNKQDYANRLAAMLEYARRCFDNDRRITTEAVGGTDSNGRSRGEYQNSSATLSGHAAERTNRDRGQIARRVSNQIPGGQSAGREHFLKLYNEAAQEAENERHSDNRGAFSNGKADGNKRGSRSERKFYRAVPATDKNMGIANQLGAVLQNGYMVFDTAEGAEAYDQHIQNMARDNFKYSFAGEKALTASHEKLAEAQQMEEAGKTRSAIFKKTGWIKGKDDKWRFEIPDNLDKINFDKLKRDGESTLGEVYDNSKLYEAYPELENIPVDIKGSRTFVAQFHPVKNRITLNKKILKDDPLRIKGSLVHEIQHAIQTIESFASGGSEEYVDQLLARTIMQIDKEIEEITGIHDASAAFGIKASARFGEYFLTNFRDENKIDEQKQKELRKNLSETANKRLDYLVERALELQKAYYSVKISDYDKYKKIGGEEEAEEVRYRAEAFYRETDYLPKKRRELANAKAEFEAIKAKATKEQLEIFGEYKATVKAIEEISSNPNVLKDPNYNGGKWKHAEVNRLLERLEGDLEYYKGRKIVRAYIKQDKLAQEVAREESALKMGKGTPTVHSADALITYNGEEYAMASMAPPEMKFAGNGDLKRMFAEATPVSDAQLNGKQRKWVALGKSLGVQVQWIDADKGLKGALRDGVIYLNRNGTDSTEKIFWHEQFHLAAALQPELYRDLLKYFSGNDAFTKDQLDAYRKENNRPDLTDEAVIEEILSDNFGQVQKRVQLLRELGRDDSSLAERFITWLKYLADKVAATFRNPEGGMTTAQRDAFIKGISDLADSMQVTDAAKHEGMKFSASPSTAEKLKTKIQNLFTQTQNERPRKHMVKLLEKLSGYQIRTGHVADGIDILVKDISKIIRTKRAYDWELMLPEVGKLVAKRLNLNPTKEQGNYIASWLMDGAPNDTSQAAKDFQRAMREADPMYRDQLLEVQSIFGEWASRPPEQIVRDSIAFGNEKQPLSNQARDFFNDSYSQFVEELYPVKQLVDEFEEDRGEKLSADENPFTILRNSRGIAGRAKIMIEGGAEAIDAIKVAFPNIDFSKYKTPLKTIRMILDSVDALDNKENRKEFSDYLLACSVKDLHRRNAANMRQQYELRDKIDTLEEELDTLTDKKKIKETEKRIAKLQDELKTLKGRFYATPFSEKVCDGTIAKYKDKYGEAQQDMMRYSRALLDMMVDGGLLSEESRAGFIKNFPNHVPMFRKFDENEDKSFGDSLKAMTGSSRDVIDPLDSIIRNTYDFIRRAEKNKAKILLANLARAGGTGRIVEERTILDEVDNKKPDINTTITFYENGQKKYLETDASVVKAVNNMTVPQMSWYMKIMRVGTMLLRNFATVYNPAFAFRNLIMDSQNAMLYSKYGWFSPADFVRGFLSVWNRDADYNEWMAMGGAQASFWSVDRDYTQASLDALRKGRWGQYKSVKGFSNLFSALGEYSELGTRVGYYKKAKKALAEKNSGKIDRGVLIQAALESRDLTDFARGGKTSRDWNSAVAFANASIQGWDKFLRTFDPRQYWSKDPEVRKEWERAMFRLAIGSILPTVLLFMLNHDEDWYEEDLPDWERQQHWCLGEHLRIPKGQDVGLRFFSNLTESMLRYTAKNDPKAFKEWWKPAWDSLPDILPTALQPIFECAANYDMFRKNAIVPARQQKLPEYMQYDSRTSALAKGIGDSSLAKFLAGETGISPKKIDHFIYGYVGKLGQDFIRLGQNALGTVFGKDDWVNYSRFTDLPIINGIKSGFLRVPYRNPQIMNEYYETLDEQTKLHNEFKMTKKRPEGYNHSLYTKLKKAQEQMQELTKKERKILDDTKLDGDERDNRQLAIQKKRVALAEKVLR